jgi:hypothetical protein
MAVSAAAGLKQRKRVPEETTAVAAEILVKREAIRYPMMDK